MERRNYAVMLLFVFAIVDVYSYPGELDTQTDFAAEEFHNPQQNGAHLRGIASESFRQNLDADILRRTKRHNNARKNTNGRQPATPAPTTESSAVVAARLAAERELERRRIVTEYQSSIQAYMRQGYTRPVAIELTIKDNLSKAYRMVELSVFPYD